MTPHTYLNTLYIKMIIPNAGKYIKQQKQSLMLQNGAHPSDKFWQFLQNVVLAYDPANLS